MVYVKWKSINHPLSAHEPGPGVYHHSASTVTPPFTTWLSCTFSAVPGGSNTSTRDPNFMNPISAHCSTCCPGDRSLMIRLARAPAICFIRRLPFGFFITTLWRSFSVEDFGFQATRYLPLWY